MGTVRIGAHVNGHPLNGVLDSDSDETFLDTQIAQRLGPWKQNNQSGSTLGRVESGTIGPLSFDLGSSISVASKPRILPIGDHLPGVDFILGFDALGQTPFTVDYSESLIRLGPVPHGPKTPFLPGRDTPSAQVSFLKLQINAVVDTGAPAGLDVPISWIKSKLSSVQLGPSRPAKGSWPKI